MSQRWHYSGMVFARSSLVLFILLLAACGGGGSSITPVGSNGSGGRPPPDTVDPGTLEALVSRAGAGPVDVASLNIPSLDDPLVGLGKILFFSRTLGADYDVACASCHHPFLGGGDGLSLPVGVAAREPWHLGPGRKVDPALDQDPQRDCVELPGSCGPNVPRNSQTTFNAALYEQAMFFDGRVQRNTDGQIRTPESGNVADAQAGDTLLAAQALLPVTSNAEMRGFGRFDLADPDALRRMLLLRFTGEEEPGFDHVSAAESENWFQLFSSAFPQQGQAELLDYANVQAALAAYQRTQVFVDSPWQRYLTGKGELTAAQAQGARLFYSSVEEGGLGCAQCHSGPHFTDEQFHNLGFPQLGRGKRINRADLGRGDVTRAAGDNYAFRTPSLLNVSLTAPYGHAGSFATLEDALRYHADPDWWRFTVMWPSLAQFEGLDLLLAYPSALVRTLEALSADSFAGGLLPQRSLTQAELDSMRSFLSALTDSCAASSDCVAVWVPRAGAMPEGDDPDGNLLVIGQPSPVDSEPGELANPSVPVVDVALNYPDLPVVSSFAELESCSASQATNTGESRFEDRSGYMLLAAHPSGWPPSALELGPDFSHGFARDTWFSSSISADSVQVAGGVSAAYLDEDCWPDLVFAAGDDGGGLRFYLSASGKYLVHTPDLMKQSVRDDLGIMINAVAFADLDGDYRREMVLPNLLASFEGEGSFDGSGSARTHISILASDANGQWDLAGQISMYRNTFTVAFGDLDGDRDLDMYAPHWGFGIPAAGPVLWRNDLNGFTAADSAAGISSADGSDHRYEFTAGFWDADNDGLQDLAVAADFNTSLLYRSVGPGGLPPLQRVHDNQDLLTDENAMGSAVADFDNDGDQDWFVTSVYDSDGKSEGFWGVTGNRLYRNKATAGSMEFEDATDEAGVRDGAWGWGACAADFNNDGWVDIFHENGYGYIPDSARDAITGSYIDLYATVAAQFLFTPPRLFINQGLQPDDSLLFHERAADWGLDDPTNVRGVVCVDIDRDGDVDLVTQSHSAPPRVLLNQVGGDSGSRFASVKLIGASPNTESIGAEIRLRADTNGDDQLGEGETQYRQVQLNGNYVSYNLTDVHFGLGAAAIISELQVRWPNDPVVLVCAELAVNSHIVVDQRNKQCP